MESLDRSQFVQLRNGYMWNNAIILDMRQMATRLSNMDKETREKFAEFVDLVYKRQKFLKDQLALMNPGPNLEKRAATKEKSRKTQAVLAKFVSDANKQDGGCERCGGTGFIDAKDKMCSCPAREVWAAKERERLGIRKIS